MKILRFNKRLKTVIEISFRQTKEYGNFMPRQQKFPEMKVARTTNLYLHIKNYGVCRSDKFAVNTA